MKSVGEVMSLGRTFKEALQKALRGLEIGAQGLGADGKSPGESVADILKNGTPAQKDEQMRLLHDRLRVPNCVSACFISAPYAARRTYRARESCDLHQDRPLVHQPDGRNCHCREKDPRRDSQPAGPGPAAAGETASVFPTASSRICAASKSSMCAHGGLKPALCRRINPSTPAPRNSRPTRRIIIRRMKKKMRSAQETTSARS